MSNVTNKRVTPLTGASLHRSFSSEALLQQALAVLLTRMPDITGVQILQGTQELGKDLIFYIRGGFGERILCACVVKNSKITGQVDKSRGARTVLFQAQQAFDSVHTDVSGKDTRVERVYVVTPFDLSQETIQSIKGALQERAGQIKFIGGTILFDLFKQFWPDYFADETEFIESYLRDAKTNFESENPLKSLGAQYNLGEINSYSKAIYVQQVLFREVYYYELGELLKSKIAKASDYEAAVSKATVDFLTSKVNQVRSAIQFLTEWKLCSQSHKDALFNLSAALISALDEGWRKAEKPLKAKYGIEHRVLS